MSEENINKPLHKKWWVWVILAAIILALVFVIAKRPNSQESGTRTSDTSVVTNSSSKTATEKSYWKQTDSGWQAVGTPPACPEPMVLSIGDISSATSAIYPGQMRSVGYEPTAGFRFDKATNNEMTILSPLDGEIVQAARFYEKGDIQYVLDIMSPCGIMNRFDHLLALPATLQPLADKLPEAKADDTRSTSISPPVKVAKGDVIATATGSTGNVGLSWTIYDFRQKNKISQNPDWAAKQPALYHYAICPFVYMTAEDQAIVKNLPAADMTSGSKSDFCDGIWP